MLSLALLLIEYFIYYLDLDYVDPIFRHLLKYDGIEFIYILPDLYYYFVYIMILLSYFLIYIDKKFGKVILLSSIIFICISYFLSGVRFISSSIDLVGVISTFFWGSILCCIHVDQNEKFNNKSNAYNKNILIYSIVFLFNLQLFLSYSPTFDGDMYYEWAKYDAPAINENFFILGIVLIHLSLLSIYLKKKWSKNFFYIMTVYYLFYSIFSGIRIGIPEMMIIRLVMEVIWGALLFIIYIEYSGQEEDVELSN
ncbi:hypothetical protein ACQEXU_11360 [Vibrio sp. TRT 21S02]|uniref:hypothetical protein n=1 Tax=Vibrio sp. TRT 21S02 TaxID=3418507 RepID=UPI003CFAB109